MRITKSFARAAAISLAVACLVGSAQADRWRGGHRWHHHHHHNSGGAALFGLAAGLIVGSALSPGYGYGPGTYGPGYYQPYRPRYYYGSPGYYGGPWQNAAGCCYYGPYGYDPAYRVNR